MIYFMQAGEGGHVKIGWSKNRTTLDSRRILLQTGQSRPITVIRVIEDAPRWAEIWLHKEFASVRKEGEWFEYQPAMLSITLPLGGDAPGLVNSAIHLRLPDDLRDAVEGLATTEDRTLLDMIRRLLKEAVANRRGEHKPHAPGLTPPRPLVPPTAGQQVQVEPRFKRGAVT